MISHEFSPIKTLAFCDSVKRGIGKSISIDKEVMHAGNNSRQKTEAIEDFGG